MTSVAGLQLDGLATGERLSELFPKCRPRDPRDGDSRDVVRDAVRDAAVRDAVSLGLRLPHAHDANNKMDVKNRESERPEFHEEDADDASGSGVDTSDEDSEDTSPSQAQRGDSPVILLGKTNSYKLRDSRIIEIAGGREVFCQSRSKAARKSRQHLNSRDDGDKMSASNSKNGKTTTPENRVWELRARCTDSKRQRNLRDSSDGFSSESRPSRHRNSNASLGGSVYESVPTSAPSLGMTGGDVVVFDDIGDDWRGVVSSSPATTPSPPGHHRAPAHYFKVSTSVSDVEVDSLSPDRDDGDENSKVARVIGNLPIAEYEGSPRRYGIRQTDSPHCSAANEQSTNVHPTLVSAHSLLGSPSIYSPRPGFPQRVVPERTSSPPTSTASTSNSTFDYLYEFSETRKVLEEFFKPSIENSSPEECSPHFQELEYELRRQASQVSTTNTPGTTSLSTSTGTNVGGSSSGTGSAYVGLRLAKAQPEVAGSDHGQPTDTSTDLISLQEQPEHETENNLMELSTGSGSTEDLGDTEVGLQVGHSRNFTLSPETTDCDSNCGDLDSEVSLLLTDADPITSIGGPGGPGDSTTVDTMRLYSSMPVLEDGLSSGHASDTDNNNPTRNNTYGIGRSQPSEPKIPRPGRAQVLSLKRQSGERDTRELEIGITPSSPSEQVPSSRAPDPELEALDPLTSSCHSILYRPEDDGYRPKSGMQSTPPPPAPAPHRSQANSTDGQGEVVDAVIKDIRMALQRVKTLPVKPVEPQPVAPTASPIWVPRRRVCETELRRNISGDEHIDDDEADTDLETDRLLGQLRTDDTGFYEPQPQKGWRKPKCRTLLPSPSASSSSSSHAVKNGSCSVTTPLLQPAKQSPPGQSACSHSGLSVASLLGGSAPPDSLPLPPNSVPCSTSGANDIATASDDLTSPEKSPSPHGANANGAAGKSKKDKDSGKKKGRNKEDLLHNPSVLIEGVLFRARYLGSTQLVCEGQPTKSTRMMQAEEAVSRIKAPELPDLQPVRPEEEKEAVVPREREVPVPITPPVLNAPGTSMFRLAFLGSVEVEEGGGRRRRRRLKKTMVEEAVAKIKAPEGETQPSTEVDLFISTEKIMVLNTDLKEIMMDHALRTISYIADIGDLVVLMARRRFMPQEEETESKLSRTPKMICHVFQSEEAQFIAQSIGQAFQVAYMEFLKANGIEDNSFVKEMDYQEVLNSQEIFGDELQMFAKKEMQKEVVVPKAKGEILGVVIVESGWGSMLPTVVIANLAPAGAAARCGQLNIGDQIIAINGVSLVGLPLSTCQNYIKNTKTQTVVKLTVVPCAPVVEVKIKRPETKYQLGFSVQNGVICSLLRGGIAERGGVRVGHRIIEINNQSVVAVPHEKIVNLLATSVGEILMKTMPTSMFRLLTGQETPIYI